MNLAQHLQDRLRSWVAPRSRMLCALSGGPDSVALAHLLKNSSQDIVLGHVDHQMRAGAAQDARFVRNLAHRWALPCEIVRVAVPRHAAKHQLGLEEAARELRYKALVVMAEKSGCSVIVTAHTADDQAETVLMNFLRGAGSTGLAGIPPQRELKPGIRVIRPLLDVPHEALLQYLRSRHLTFRTDPSNRLLRFTRNRIRHQLLPLLEKEFPDLRKRLLQMAEIFREEENLWSGRLQGDFDKTVRQNNKKITVDLPQLLGYHKALGRRILRRLLKGISFQDTERVFQLAQFPAGNSTVQLSGGLWVQRKGKELIVHNRGLHG